MLAKTLMCRPSLLHEHAIAVQGTQGTAKKAFCQIAGERCNVMRLAILAGNEAKRCSSFGVATENAWRIVLERTGTAINCKGISNSDVLGLPRVGADFRAAN